MFDLNLMRVLVAIVDAGTLSGAAQRLGVTRAQVSRNLKSLERQLEVLLIRRTTRSLELTQQGSLVYEHATRAIREMETARYLVQQMGAQPSGHVRVSVPTALGELLLGRLLIDFAQRYEGISVRVRLSNRVSDLISSEVDVAVRVVNDPPDGYVARHVTTIDWHLCASSQYLETVSPIKDTLALENHRMLLPPTGKLNNVLTIQSPSGLQDVNVQTKLESESFPYLAQAAAQGVGIVLLPSYYAAHMIQKKTLVRVLPDCNVIFPDNKIYILTAPSPYPSSASRAVVEFIAKSLADELENF